MTRNLAFEAVAALARAPGNADAMRRQRLPAGVTQLLDILAGDNGTLLDFATKSGVPSDEAFAAVEFYVKSILLYADAPHWRVLGHEMGAPRDHLRQHMRLLMIWLHPDRAISQWQANYARRVIEAWKFLSKQKATSTPKLARTEADCRSVYTRPWIRQPLTDFASSKRFRAKWVHFSLFVIIFTPLTLLPSGTLDAVRAQAKTFLGLD